jgi:hypothetical protein
VLPQLAILRRTALGLAFPYLCLCRNKENSLIKLRVSTGCTTLNEHTSTQARSLLVAESNSNMAKTFTYRSLNLYIKSMKMIDDLATSRIY